MFVEVCIGISLIVVAIGVFIALYNVSVGYKHSKMHTPEKRAPVPQDTVSELTRHELTTRLDGLTNQRFGVSMSPIMRQAPDGAVMGGNPNAARLAAASKEKNLRRSPEVRKAKPAQRKEGERRGGKGNEANGIGNGRKD